MTTGDITIVAMGNTVLFMMTTEDNTVVALRNRTPVCNNQQGTTLCMVALRYRAPLCDVNKDNTMVAFGNRPSVCTGNTMVPLGNRASVCDDKKRQHNRGVGKTELMLAVTKGKNTVVVFGNRAHVCSDNKGQHYIVALGNKAPVEYGTAWRKPCVPVCRSHA